MRFSLSPKGAHLAGGVTMLLLTALALLPISRFWVRMLWAAGLSALVWGYCRLYAATAVWGVQGGVFYARSGLLFTRERSLALDEMTAVTWQQSPLSRPLGLCRLTVCGAGSFVSLPFVQLEDAHTLQRLWQAST